MAKSIKDIIKAIDGDKPNSISIAEFYKEIEDFISGMDETEFYQFLDQVPELKKRINDLVLLKKFEQQKLKPPQ